MADLLALTLLRPWEQSILHLGKDIENRKWHPGEQVRGQRIALHAGKGYDDEGAAFIIGLAPTAELDRWEMSVFHSKRSSGGHIVGTARVADWFRHGELHPQAKNRWAFGPWCWTLADVFALPEPVPCKGALSLWRVPPDVAARVLAQEAAR